MAMGFASIMDYVQALFSFFIAPLFGTVLLGMLWKRATPAGGFCGLLAGTLSTHWGFFSVEPEYCLGGGFPRFPRAQGLAPDMFPALLAGLVWAVCAVGGRVCTNAKPG